MTDSELFNGPGDNNDPTPLVPLEGKEYLEKYVGEGKKHENYEELAKSTAHKEMHIQRLEQEQAGLRKELEQRLTMEKFLDEIKSTRENTSQSRDEENTTRHEDQGNNTSSVTNEDIQSLIAQTVEEKLTRDRLADNVVKVHSKAREVLGENYKEILSQRAEALGLDQEYLSELAAKKPQGFINIMVQPKEFKSEGLFRSVPDTQVNTSSFKPGDIPIGAKTKSYFDKIQKDNPGLYWTPKVQMELHESAVNLGDKFDDTNK